MADDLDLPAWVVALRVPGVIGDLVDRIASRAAWACRLEAGVASLAFGAISVQFLLQSLGALGS